MRLETLLALLTAAGDPVIPGRPSWTCCPDPTHLDRHPSCALYPDPDSHFHCYAAGCHAHGTYMEFVRLRWFATLEKREGYARARELLDRGGVPSGVSRPFQRATGFDDEERLALAVALVAYQETFWSPAGLPARQYLRRRFPHDPLDDLARVCQETMLGYGTSAAFHAIVQQLRGEEEDEWLRRIGVRKTTAAGIPGTHRLEGRLIVPEVRAEGPVYYQARTLQPGKRQRHSYLSPAAPKRLLGWGRALEHPTTPIALVEGPLDYLAVCLAGWCGLATLGSALSEDLTPLLQDREVIVAFDHDEGGYALFEESVPWLRGARTRHWLLLPSGDDPASYATEHGAGALHALLL